MADVDFLMGGSWVKQQVPPAACGPSPLSYSLFPLSSLFGCFGRCGRGRCLFSLHSHKWRAESSAHNALRGEGHAHSNTYTGLACRLWRLITAAAATVDAESSRQTPGSFSGGSVTCLASFIYLFICSCVCLRLAYVYITRWTEWPEVCAHLRTSEIKTMR